MIVVNIVQRVHRERHQLVHRCHLHSLVELSASAIVGLCHVRRIVAVVAVVVAVAVVAVAAVVASAVASAVAVVCEGVGLVALQNRHPKGHAVTANVFGVQRMLQALPIPRATLSSWLCAAFAM